MMVSSFSRPVRRYACQLRDLLPAVQAGCRIARHYCSRLILGTMLRCSIVPVMSNWARGPVQSEPLKAGTSVMDPSRIRARHRGDHPCDRRLGRSQWATSPSLLAAWSASDTCASRRVRPASTCLYRSWGAFRAGGLAYLHCWPSLVAPPVNRSPAWPGKRLSEMRCKTRTS